MLAVPKSVSAATGAGRLRADELVAVAGARWAVEECFQAGKNETGLDHYQVRRYDAWCNAAGVSHRTQRPWQPLAGARRSRTN